jgi:hypothetical protein
MTDETSDTRRGRLACFTAPSREPAPLEVPLLLFPVHDSGPPMCVSPDNGS